MLFFHCSCLSSQCEYYEKNFWSAVWIVGYWRSDSSVLSSSYNVSGFQMKGKQRKNGAFMSLTILYSTRSVYIMSQVRVYHERVYADNVVSKFWFVRSLSSQHHSKLIANIATENVSQVHIKECKTRSFNCKVNLNFLRLLRHFNCDTAFAVIVSFLNESVHGFNNIRNGRVKSGFQTEKFRPHWEMFYQKTWIFSLWHFGKLMDKIFPKLQPAVELPHSVAPVKRL